MAASSSHTLALPQTRAGCSQSMFEMVRSSQPAQPRAAMLVPFSERPRSLSRVRSRSKARLLSGNWVANTAWGSGLGYSPVGNAPVQLAFLASSVVGTTSLRGVFALDDSTGALQGNYPDGGVQADPGSPVITQSDYLFGSGITPSPLLYSVSPTFSTGSANSMSDPLIGAPLVGQGGLAYLATVGGTLECRADATTVRWSGSFGAG